MNDRSIRRARRIGVAASTVLGVTLATAAPTFATPTAASASASSAFASSASASVANDTLTVIGTNGADRLALRLAAGNANILQVDFGDDDSADAQFDRSTFRAVEVSLRGGDDVFRVDQTNGSFPDEALTVRGGRGDDTINGGDGNDVLYGNSGRDIIDGNHGVDTAFLGSGEDTFKWDPGDGSDVVDGGSGRDTMLFNGAIGDERMSLSANGSRSVFLRDPGSVRMDMDHVERLDLHTFGGADAVTINDTTGTDLREADIDLSGSTPTVGDGQIDQITLNGREQDDHVEVHASRNGVEAHGLRPEVRITGSDTTDRFEINTLDGNDTVHVDDDVARFIAVGFDLGAGQH